MGLFDYPEHADRGVPLDQFIFLEGLTEQDWKKILAVVETRQFRAGEDLLRPGDPGDSFYILTAGSVEVLVPGEDGLSRTIVVIPEGSVFGEVAFFDGGVRSATVRAREAGTAIHVTRDKFDVLAAWEPALARHMLFDLGRALALRLRRTTSRA